jgi:para-aminobenzoate synthetase component 1
MAMFLPVHAANTGGTPVPRYDLRVIRIRPIDAWRYPQSACRLDSATGVDSSYSRWSYRTGPPKLTLRCDRPRYGAVLLATTQDEPIQRWNDPIDALEWVGHQFRRYPADFSGPPFKGGWVGFISYDAGRMFETLPITAQDDLSVPCFEFHFFDSIDACDHAGRLFAVDLEEAERPGASSRERYTAGHSCRDLSGVSPPAVDPFLGRDSLLTSNFNREAYQQAVGRVIEYIRAGDAFQVNLSQRFTLGLGRERPSEIYERLLAKHPAWYGAFLAADEYALLCNSPEQFLRVQPTPRGRRVTTRPIKGTRPLGPGMREALTSSEKDLAELNMIVDLERNDLGRVCEIGSIRVTEPRVIEAHPTVYHGAATIEGTFPGGSVTGAPKIRAMQIIEELEPVRRGPYCGAIGYLSVDGNIELNVAIRTMIVEQGRVHIPVGGGIVADSDPLAEYEETLVKARAMFAALKIEEPQKF